MKAEEFFRIRKELKGFSDFKRFKKPRGMLFSILIQKRIENVKRRYHLYASRLHEIANHWEKHREIPNWLRLPPVMRIRLLMKSLGMSNKEIANSLSNPERSEFQDMIWDAIYKDFIYSPIAIRNQFARGRVGEEMIRQFLEKMNVEFKDENMLRPASKTPDFYIEDKLRIDGREVKWIESKALFGDLRLHRFYSKKQYDRYIELYGDGVVVYWLGKIDELSSNALIKDCRFVENKAKRFLLNMEVFLANKKAEELAESLETDVFYWQSDVLKSKQFLHEIFYLFDSIKGNVVISGWSRELRGVLRNMGFKTIIFD